MLNRLRNFAAAFREHHRDPEDVAKGVRMIDASAIFLGRGDGTLRRRMCESEMGRKLLDERHSVLAMLCDRDGLRRLPAGSLGRVYVEFAEINQLYPEKLAELVAEARADTGGVVPEASEEIAYLHDRFRDLHDLFHVVTGYGTDMGGEMGLHGFQNQQTNYRAMQLISFVNCFRAVFVGRADVMKLWWEGRRRAKKVPFLVAQDWGTLLARPLEEVREMLGVNPIPQYQPYHVSAEHGSGGDS